MIFNDFFKILTDRINFIKKKLSCISILELIINM